MPIINHEDIIKKGNPVDELTKSLEALIKVEDKLVKQNKKVAESIDLIEKSSDGKEAKKLIQTTDKLTKSTLKLKEVKTSSQRVNEEILRANTKLAQSRTKEAKQLALVKQRTLEQNKALREQAKASLGVQKSNNGLRKSLQQVGLQFAGVFAAVQGLRGAFKLLTGVIGATAEGQVFLAKVTGATNAVLANLRDRLIDGWKAMTDFSAAAEDNRSVMERLGDWYTDFYTVRGKGVLNIFKGIGSYLKGDFKEGIEGVNDGFIQMVTGTEEATKKTKELITQLRIMADFGAAIAGAEKKLELDRSRTAIQQAKDIRNIADLRVKAADKENFTGKQRVVFIQKAIDLTKKLGVENIDFAKRELGLQQAVFNSANSNIDDEIELNKLKQKADEVKAASSKKLKLLTAELQTASNEAAKEDIANAKKVADAKIYEAKRVSDALSIPSTVSGLDINAVIEDDKKASLDRISEMNDDFRKQEAAKENEANTERLKRVKDWEEAALVVKDAAIAAAGQILSDSISFGIDAQAAALEEANNNEIDRNTEQAEAEKEILQQKLNDNLITETEYKNQSAKIDEDARIKNEKLEKDTKTAIAIADKKKALFDVGIATAVGVARSIPNPVAMALAATLGALQLAVVAARPIPKFEKGEVNIKGKRHSQGGMLAEIEGGESYINRMGTANAPNILNDINNGLIKDSDLDMMKNTDYSYNMLQLNGLVDELKINGSFAKETNKLLSKTGRTYERNGMLIFEDINGNIIKKYTTN